MANTFTFVDEDPYVGTLSRAVEPATCVGAIIWAMGIAEMRAARTLAKLGIHAMQIRRKSRPPQSGPLLTRGRQAMDLLQSECGVDRFILMGNCGFAAASFNLALQDERVAGLILSNPHASEYLAIPSSYARKLRSLDSWKRFITGRLDFKQQVRNAGLLRKALVTRFRGVEEKTVIQKLNDPVVTLPDDVPGKLTQLSVRGVHTLLLFAETDMSLDFFKKTFGASLESLDNLPRVTTRVLPTKVHRLSEDDDASGIAADVIRAWAREAFLEPAAATDTAA